MTNVTSSSDSGRRIALRVDLTGVLACLLMAVIVACAIIGYGTRHRIDDVVQPVCAGLVLPMPWLRSHS